MKEILITDDMGTDNVLRIIFEDDGDVVVSIVKYGQRFGDSVQICTSGTNYPLLASELRKVFDKFSNL